MILSFNKQFLLPILDGKKIHSIRLDKANRWNKGRTIQMATGVRTKNYYCFSEGECISTQKIAIYSSRKRLIIYVDGKKLEDVYALIKNDGFFCVNDFLEWFFPRYKTLDGEIYYQGIFRGKIIHWTDFKY